MEQGRITTLYKLVCFPSKEKQFTWYFTSQKDAEILAEWCGLEKSAVTMDPLCFVPTALPTNTAYPIPHKNLCFFTGRWREKEEFDEYNKALSVVASFRKTEKLIEADTSLYYKSDVYCIETKRDVSSGEYSAAVYDISVSTFATAKEAERFQASKDQYFTTHKTEIRPAIICASDLVPIKFYFLDQPATPVHIIVDLASEKADTFIPLYNYVQNEGNKWNQIAGRLSLNKVGY